MTPSHSRLLDAIRSLALVAGAEILRWYGTDAGTVIKADGSPVTLADQAAETLILAGLATLTPEIPVVAEEAAAAGRMPDVGQAPFWLVDPLDGTKEFLNRNGEFTVNIALVNRDGPLLGVVLAPAPGELYAGIVGQGAFMSLNGAPDRPITARIPPAAGWIALGSRSHGDAAAEAEACAAYPVSERRPRGSSLKFCTIAAGEADLYIRTGPTHEWDTAAGHAVLLAAGGRVEALDETPLRYGKPKFRNAGFRAFGSQPPRP